MYVWDVTVRPVTLSATLQKQKRSLRIFSELWVSTVGSDRIKTFNIRSGRASRIRTDVAVDYRCNVIRKLANRLSGSVGTKTSTTTLK